jgi:catechol 2,3-dioxygenase-like lactoylglutathione lyase family enzyme
VPDTWKTRSLFHLNINCSDLERSIVFYEALGFRQVFRFDVDEEADESYAGMGVTGRVVHRGPCVMFLGDDPYQTRLDLMQWITPAPAAHAPPAAQDVGVPRVAIWTKNIDALYAELTTGGLEFLSPPVGPFAERAIERVLYTRDPDGLIVEFIEFTPKGRSLYASSAEGDATGS